MKSRQAGVAHSFIMGGGILAMKRRMLPTSQELIATDRGQDAEVFASFALPQSFNLKGPQSTCACRVPYRVKAIRASELAPSPCPTPPMTHSFAQATPEIGGSGNKLKSLNCRTAPSNARNHEWRTKTRLCKVAKGERPLEYRL